MIPFSFLSFILLFLFSHCDLPSSLHMFSMLFMCACWRFYHHHQWCKQDQILKLMCHSRSLWRRAWQHNTRPARPRPQWARPRPRPIFGLASLVLRPTVSDHITDHHHHHRRFIMTPPLGWGTKWWCCLTSVAYIRHKSRTERPRKTKIGTEKTIVIVPPHLDVLVKG